MHRPQLWIQALGPSDFVVNNRGINTRFTYGKVAHQVEVHIEGVRLYAASDSEAHFEDVEVRFVEGTVTSDRAGGFSASLGFFLRHLLQLLFCWFPSDSTNAAVRCFIVRCFIDSIGVRC